MSRIRVLSGMLQHMLLPVINITVKTPEWSINSRGDLADH